MLVRASGPWRARRRLHRSSSPAAADLCSASSHEWPLPLDRGVIRASRLLRAHITQAHGAGAVAPDHIGGVLGDTPRGGSPLVDLAGDVTTDVFDLARSPGQLRQAQRFFSTAAATSSPACRFGITPEQIVERRRLPWCGD